MTIIPANITRKGLASLVNLSTDQIRKEEKRIGLNKTRAGFNKHAVLYRTVEALEIFRQRGFSIPRIILINEVHILCEERPLRPQQPSSATSTKCKGQ